MRTLTAVVATALLTIASVPSAAAECRVEGTVVDPAGVTLADAFVMVEETGATATTDADGAYCFEEVAEGTRHLFATADGYQPQRSQPLEIADASIAADLVLQPTFRGETVVTATRTERRLDEVPVRTELVRRDAIDRIEARTLAEAVEFTTGVQVESSCQNCNFSQIRLLGLDGAYTQLLVDSQPIISSLAQVYGIEHIPARMIERIEVVKGGGSAVYGSGSVGGVVNVIPWIPSRTGGALELRSEQVDGNDASSFNGAFDWVSADQNLFVSAFGQEDDLQAVDVDGDGFSELGRRDLASYGVRAGAFLLDGDGRLSFDYARVREDRRGGDNLHLPETMAQIAEAVDTTRDVVSLSWMHDVGRKFDYRVTVSWADTKRDTYYGSGGDPNAYGSTDNPLLILDTQINRKVGSHYLSAGLQYSRDQLTDVQPAYDRMIEDTYENLGLFVQDDWFIGRGWELVYGARVDDFSEIEDPIVSPRVALKHDLAPNATWRLSVSSGFRGPQVFDEDLHITQVGGEGHVIRNAPELQEESSLSTSLGIEWSPLVAGGIGIVEANLFDTRIDDLFLVIEGDDPVTPQFELFRTNYGGARVRGLELNFGWAHGDDLQLELGFVVQEAERDEADPDFGSTSYFRTPDSYGVASVAWATPLDVEMWLGARYTGSMKVPHYAGWIDEDRLETTDPFLALDVRFAYDLPLFTDDGTALELALGGRNVTDAFQDDLDRGPDRDAGYLYGPRSPRSWYLSMGVVF